MSLSEFIIEESAQRIWDADKELRSGNEDLQYSLPWYWEDYFQGVSAVKDRMQTVELLQVSQHG